MNPGQYSEPPPLREAFGQFIRLARLVSPYWGGLARGIVLGGLVGLLGMVGPYLSKLLIDVVYPSQNVSLMYVLVGGLLALSVGSAALGALRSYYTLQVSTRLMGATTLLFFNHLQHLPNRFYTERRVGEIMSRFGDVRSALNTLSDFFGTVVIQGMYLLLVPPVLFMLEWRLALAAVAVRPLTMAVSVLSARVLRRHHQRAAEASAELGAYQVEVFSQIRTLRSMAVEPAIFQEAKRLTQAVWEHQLRAGAYGQSFGLLNGVLGAFGTALYTWLGWRFILSGEMTLGGFFAFMAYLGYFSRPLARFTGLFTNFHRSAVSLGRMFEYLDIAPEADPTIAYTRAPSLRHRSRGEVRLRDVHLSYAAGKTVLHGVSLLFEPGSTTALVGPSGAGKSSLLSLICAMEHPDRGEIQLDGVPIRNIPLADLRRQISVVWQEVGLIRGTLRENLMLGTDGSGEYGLEEALRISRLTALVADLPAGLETPVAEWGASLSGGQRQRIALARALVRNAPVLLLDEVTASLDHELEAGILGDILRGARECTVLLVTHRVGSATLADQVCVLEQGRVVGFGHHDEVMSNCELYRRLHAAGGSADYSGRLKVVPGMR